MTAIAQRSFTGGELAPALYGRVDTVKYATGLRICRNFIVKRSGGVSNRPGTEYICEVKDSTKRVKLIPFIFNDAQTYELEFGNLYMRVIRNGAQVTVSGVTAWSNVTAYVVGDLVSRLGVNYYCILAHTNQQPPNATYWYPLTGSIYEIPTPYLEADLQDIHYIQSGDVVTLLHRTYPTKELARTGHTAWTLSTIPFVPAQAAPTSVTNSGAAGSTTEWVVTAIASETFEESLASSSTGSSATPSSGSPITISWAATSGAQEYNVYKKSNGIYGFIGVAGGTSFIDNGISADTTDTPPTARNPFTGTDNYPATGTYIQQRLVLANTNNDPEKIWLGRSANFKNFTVSSPTQDDDAITFTVAGRQVNEVQNLVDVGKLLIFTTGGEWSAEGDSAGIITPAEINPRQNSYFGSNNIQPVLIGSTVLYVQNRGSIIRDITSDLVEGYKSSDLTIFSTHLFDGYSIENWAFQQIPNSVVLAVRDDGDLNALTYVREHQVFAWHRHDTDGIFENVSVVPEGMEDVPYYVVKRTINGTVKRYIERQYSRFISDIVDAVFLDCALTYDGRNTGSTTMTLSGSGWTHNDTLTLTASASFFVSGDIGNEIHLTGSDGTLIRFEITGYTSGTVVTGRPNKNVPVAMQATAMLTWGKAVDTLSNLSHLEGKDVGVFADGFVVASPNNSSYNTITVASAQITLERPYVVIHVGLPYLSDVETLDIDTINGETLSDKKKLINKVTVLLEESRGGFFGSQPPEDDDDDPLQGLYELKLRDAEDYDDPVELVTNNVDINIESGWNSNGRVFIRQVDPLPMTILGIVPTGLIPIRG